MAAAAAEIGVRSAATATGTGLRAASLSLGPRPRRPAPAQGALAVSTRQLRPIVACNCNPKDASASASASTSASDLDHVPDVQESSWDELVLGCGTPVLVEFWAPWCGPCRLMHPIIADLAKAYAGRLRCLKLNTDVNQDVATKNGIRSIPTILLFKNGERKETVVGAVGDTALATTVERFL